MLFSALKLYELLLGKPWFKLTMEVGWLTAWESNRKDFFKWWAGEFIFKSSTLNIININLIRFHFSLYFHDFKPSFYHYSSEYLYNHKIYTFKLINKGSYSFLNLQFNFYLYFFKKRWNVFSLYWWFLVN